MTDNPSRVPKLVYIQAVDVVPTKESDKQLLEEPASVTNEEGEPITLPKPVRSEPVCIPRGPIEVPRLHEVASMDTAGQLNV
jgi:hypothetical protein